MKNTAVQRSRFTILDAPRQTVPTLERFVLCVNCSAFTNAYAANDSRFGHPSQKRTHLFTVLRSPTPTQPTTPASATDPRNEPISSPFCVHQRLHSQRLPLRPPLPDTNPPLHRSAFNKKRPHPEIGTRACHDVPAVPPALRPPRVSATRIAVNGAVRRMLVGQWPFPRATRRGFSRCGLRAKLSVGGFASLARRAAATRPRQRLFAE